MVITSIFWGFVVGEVCFIVAIIFLKRWKKKKWREEDTKKGLFKEKN